MTRDEEIFRRQYLKDIDLLVDDIAHDIITFANDNDYELSCVVTDVKQRLNKRIDKIKEDYI